MEGVDANAGTRERLLEAAGEVFAEVGFRAATVRDICALAGANVAAVNYHFREKEGLYAEALRHAHCQVAAGYVQQFSALDAAPPEARLTAYVSSFMLSLFDDRRPAWHAKLLAREMIEPTRTLDELVENGIRPRYAMLQEIVRELLGPASADADLVKYCAASVMGQCLLYRHCKPVVERLEPTHPYDQEGTLRRASHIARFSIAAMRRLAGEASGGAAP